MSNAPLNEMLTIIGIRLASDGVITKDYKTWIDIEETLHLATLSVADDSRLFLLLCSWVKHHGDHVVVEKLQKLQKQRESIWLIALAIFATKNGHRNWKILIRKVEGEHALSTVKIAKQSIAFKGEVDGYNSYGFLIPKGSLRVRASDVATPQELARENHQYRNRLLYGSNWRADIITAIEMGFENPHRITKTIGCSYPSAYYVFRDYHIANNLTSVS